jgi:hypothetical protein
MPVKQFDGRICPRLHNLVGIGECFCNMRNGFCHFWMGRVEMLLPFCSKPNHPIMDVVEKLHGDIYVLLMTNDPAQQPGPPPNREFWKSVMRPRSAAVLCSAARVDLLLPIAH